MFLVIRRYAPFPTFGGGFEGDGRTSASTLATATARTVGVVQFDKTGVQGHKSFSNGSTFEGAGPWLASKIGRKYSTVKAVVSNIGVSASILTFTVHTAGANPMIPVVAPDIDTFVDVAVTFGEPTRFVGKVRGDNFPNAEVFIVEDSGRDTLLFDFRTGGGRDSGPARLFGDHADQILGTFAVNLILLGPMPPLPVIQGK